MDASTAQSIVCIGDNDEWLGNIVSAASSAGASVPNALSWAQFDSEPMTFAHPHRWAYAYIDDASVSLDVRLGSLCRSFPFGVLLELTAAAGGTDQQLFAHGFQKCGASAGNMAPLRGKQPFQKSTERCFKYRLEDYKAVPDWLNSRFWAHPEQFHL